MDLKDILLKKDEVTVVGNYVSVPIHPKLFNKNIKINQNFAYEVFSDAAHEWYNDIKKYVNTTKDQQTKGLFDIMQKNKPFLKKIDDNPTFGPNYNTTYKIEGMLNNGLVRGFCPWGSGQGSLGLGGIDNDGENKNMEHTAHIGPENFSVEKLKEYSFIQSENMNYSCGTAAYAYTQHNVYNYFQASFLECWVRNYLNEVMKQVLK